MQVTFRDNARIARLELPLRFVFAEHATLRAKLGEVRSKASVNVLELDFARVDYIDSAALGMLRCLIEAETKLLIRVLHPRPSVRELLEIADLQAYFSPA